MDTAQSQPLVNKTTVGYLLFNWIRQSWDEMGPLLLGSFLYYSLVIAGFVPAVVFVKLLGDKTTSLFPFGVILIVLSVFSIWVAVCGWFSLNRYVEQVLTFQYPAWTALFTSLPRCILPSLKFSLLAGIATAVLFFNLYAYPKMFAQFPMLRLVAVTLTLWIALYFALVQVHLIPFLVHQDCAFFTALKRAAMVVLWKPFRTFWVLVLEILFIVPSLFPPFAFIFPGIYAVLSNLSLLILLEDWQDPYEKTREALRAGA